MSADKFKVQNLRKTVLDMSFAGSTVHIPCAFSIVEIVAVLYRNFLKGINQPNEDLRDYLVLSKGHGVMALYACLHEMGWISKEQVQTYFSDGTLLKGLADAHVPGIEASTGSLGHGLSVAVGMALGAKFRKSSQKVYAIVGDGEANEGSIWEALLFAAHHKLNNLVVIFDMNKFQAMGTTEEVMELEDMQKKLEAFNFETVRINGHDEAVLEKTFKALSVSTSSKPKAIIADTVKGKGVSFMEHDNTWHYTRLNKETYAMALAELGFGENKHA